MEDLATFGAEEGPEIAGANVFGVFASKGLEPPAQILAAPGTQTVTTGSEPEETEGREQRSLVLTMGAANRL